MAEPARHHTIETASKALGVSESYVKKLIHTNQIGYLKFGRTYRIRQQDIQDYEEKSWHAPKESFTVSGLIPRQGSIKFVGQRRMEQREDQPGQKI